MTTLDRYRQNQLRDNPVFCGDVQTAFMVDRRPTASPNNGTYSGGYSFQPGPFSGSRAVLLSFGTISASSVSSGTGQITVSAWIKPNVLTRGDIVTRWVSGLGASQFDLLYGLTSGLPQFFISNGGATANSGTGSKSLMVGIWQHIAGTYDGSNICIYLNGQLQASTPSSVALNTVSISNLMIGNNLGGDGQYSGSVFAPEVITYALSPPRIASRYQIATGQQQTRRIYSIPATSNNFWFDGVQTAAQDQHG